MTYDVTRKPWQLRQLCVPLTSWTPERGTCLLSLAYLCQILLNLQVSSVKCLNPLFQHDSSFLFPLTLHPFFSGYCRHCCFLPSFSHAYFLLPSSTPWHWHSLCPCVCNNNFSSWKIRWDELVMWQIKHKQLHKPFWSIRLCLCIHLLDESLEL